MCVCVDGGWGQLCAASETVWDDSSQEPCAKEAFPSKRLGWSAQICYYVEEDSCLTCAGH